MSLRKFRQGIQLESTTAPSSPEKGMLYYDDTASALYQYNGSGWVQVGGGGGIAQWVSATSYSIGDIVWLAADNKIYRATTANSDVSFTPGNWQALSVEASSLEELSDVDLTSSVAYDTLINDGTNFVNTPPVGNYIKNSLALFNTTGFAVYADAAATSPVDGTGGSANVTITRNTTTPLRGTADFKLTKDAANRQGQGWSYDFTIDSADQSKPLKFSFDYKVSANFSYVNADLSMWIYDVTNAQLIQPTPYTLDGSGKFVGEFQTNAASTSYRAIFHVATTNASAWDVNIVNVSVSATPARGNIVAATDWQAYTPATTQGLGTISAVALYWRRVGDSIELRGRFTTGTTTAVEARLDLPTGITSSSNISTIESCGKATGTGGTSAPLDALIETSKTYITFGYSDASGGLTKRNGSSIFNSTQPVSINCLLPVQGWQTNVLISDGADTRVIASRYTGLVAGTYSSTAPYRWDTKDYDENNAVTTGANWKYTASVSGVYRVSGVGTTNGATRALYLYKNGSIDVWLNQQSVTNHWVSFAGEVKLNAGDYIDIRPDGSDTVGADADLFIAISRISGPATVSASENVNCRYSSAAGQSIPDNAITIANFATKDYDSHNAVTTGASWKFTAPKAGKYSIKSAVTFTSTSFGIDCLVSIRFHKNGTLYSRTLDEIQANGTFFKPLVLADDIYLLQGEYIDVRLFHNQGGAVALLTDAAAVFVSIHSIE